MSFCNTSVYYSLVSRIRTPGSGNECDVHFLVPGILRAQHDGRNCPSLGSFHIYLKKRPGLEVLSRSFNTGFRWQVFFLLRIFSAESYSFVIEGLRFFFGKGEYMGTISEAVPLFLTSGGKLTFAPALGSFGLCLLAALAALLLLGLEWKGDKSKPEGVFFLLWTIFSVYLALSQRRFSYLLAVNVAILTSYILWVLLESLDFETEVRKLVKSGQKTEKNTAPVLQTGKGTNSNTKSKIKTKNVSGTKNASGTKNTSKPDYFKLVSSLTLIGLVFVPCIWTGTAFAKSSGSLDPAWQESLNWLKNFQP